MTKKQIIGQLVKSIIWLLIAGFCWSAGLSLFLSNGKGFGNWILWGIFSCLPIIKMTIKNISKTAKDGAKDGSRHYTATISSDKVTVKNHTVRGFILGIIGGVLGSAIVGPIGTPILMIVEIKLLITCIVALVRINKREKQGTKEPAPIENPDQSEVK